MTIVDVMSKASLLAMSKLLAASNETISLKLDKNLTEFSIDNLKPYTVYQIQMYAFNARGKSQLTDPIRALTLAPDADAATGDSAGDAADSADQLEPNLPDTRKCCESQGVTLKK